jgi:hypothetical protein
VEECVGKSSKCTQEKIKIKKKGKNRSKGAVSLCCAHYTPQMPMENKTKQRRSITKDLTPDFEKRKNKARDVKTFAGFGRAENTANFSVVVMIVRKSAYIF